MTKDNFEKAQTINYNITILKNDLVFLSKFINCDTDIRLSFGIAGDVMVPSELRKEIIIKISDNYKQKIEKLEKEFEDL